MWSYLLTLAQRHNPQPKTMNNSLTTREHLAQISVDIGRILSRSNNARRSVEDWLQLSKLFGRKSDIYAAKGDASSVVYYERKALEAYRHASR